MDHIRASAVTIEDAAAAEWVAVNTSGSIADSYFFSELSSNLGDAPAIAWLLEIREKSERRTSMTSRCSDLPVSSDSPCDLAISASSKQTTKSCSSCGERMLRKISQHPRHQVSRPCMHSEDMPTSTLRTSSAAHKIVSISSECSSELPGTDATYQDGKILSSQMLKMGAIAGLLFTDAAHLALEKTKDAAAFSMHASCH